MDVFFYWCVLFLWHFFIYNRLAIWWEKMASSKHKTTKTPTSKHKHAHEHIILIGIVSFTGAWSFASIDKIQLNWFFFRSAKKNSKFSIFLVFHRKQIEFQIIDSIRSWYLWTSKYTKFEQIYEKNTEWQIETNYKLCKCLSLNCSDWCFRVIYACWYSLYKIPNAIYSTNISFHWSGERAICNSPQETYTYLHCMTYKVFKTIKHTRTPHKGNIVDSMKLPVCLLDTILLTL